MKSIIFTLMIPVVLVSALAKEGGDRGNGGDPTLTNRADIRLFVEHELRKEVLDTIDSIVRDDVDSQDQAFRTRLQAMIGRSLLDDVMLSTFTYQEKCLDPQNSSKGATARLLDRNGTICWSPKFLVEQGSKPSDLIGLAYHEFIHHFGDLDVDHTEASRFKKYYLKRQAKLAEKPASGLGAPSVRVISSVAMATATDPLRNNSIYGTYSNSCGFELEIDGSQLIITYINNPLSRLYCQESGIIDYAYCSHTSSYCRVGRNEKAIRVLPDGNMIIDTDTGPIKYLRQ